MKVVQELVAYFDARGRLSRRQLRRLLDRDHVASDPPASMHHLCDVAGATFYFRITGALEGQVWGSGPYTRDSAFGAAAVHAGLLRPGETGVLRVTIVPAEKSYPGSTANGVTTSDYADFPHAWRLSAI